MLKYESFKEKLNKPHIGEYTAFGVVVFQAVEMENKEIYKMSDVTTDAEVMENLVQLCNKEQLDPIHFIDVVEDMLYT